MQDKDFLIDSGADIRSENRSSKSSSVSMIAMLSTAAILIATVTFVRSTVKRDASSQTFQSASLQSAPSPYGDLTQAASAAAASSSAFTLQRLGYAPLPFFSGEEGDGVLKYKFLDRYSFVVEPSADMKLRAVTSSSSTSSISSSSTSSSSSSSFYYKYSVCSADESESCQDGVFSSSASTVVNFACQPQRTVFTLTVEKVSASATPDTDTDTDTGVEETATRVFEGTGLCLYVRREIRSLRSDDLTSFLDASHVLWEYGDSEGRRRFGEDFKSNSFLLGFHQFNAAQREADHVHDGNGFLLQHLKFTNIFEKAVDGSVAVPYWDFTIDTAEGHSKPFEAFVFRASVYGSIAMPADYSRGFTYEQDDVSAAAIPDGRWAGLQAEANDKFSDLRYGYGYMRAPWSMNPSPFISRFAKDSSSSLPSCNSHYQLVTQFDNMMDFFYMSSFAAHATVHGLTGSMFGCDIFEALVAAGRVLSSAAAGKMCSGWPFTIKEFYRKAYLTPKRDCALNLTDFKQSRCGFECAAGGRPELTSFILTHYSAEINGSQPDAGEFWSNFTCEGDGYKILPGDHIESASPADPSFWVIHPTLERLFHAKLLAGGFEEESWAADQTRDFVCKNSGLCAMNDSGILESNSFCCYGHYEDSRLLNAISGQKFDFFGPSNAEVLAASDPRSAAYSMPYIYEHFSWPHCESSFDITAALKTAATSSSISSSSSSSSSISSISSAQGGR